jgi:hypothetical protein
MLTLPLGWISFGLSSNYREPQSKEYYICAKHLHVSYTDFLAMPVFLRKYIINELVKEYSPSEKN